MIENPTRTDELKAQIAELDANIKEGKDFKAKGYGCGMMLVLTEGIRNRLAAELAALEVSHD